MAEGEDFLLNGLPVITIAANTSRGCLSVTILQSAVVEGEEEIRLGINSSVGAILETAETTILIAQDGGKILKNEIESGVVI